MFNTILFYVISFGVVLSALGVITSRSVVHSVLWLVSAMCLIAGLFVLLKAFLVAAILVLVYAGAILVLFLFVVMMVDFKKEVPATFGWESNPFPAILVGFVIFIQSFIVIRSLPVLATSRIEGSPEAVGQLLFSRYVLPFELTSFLLLAAVVSVVVLAKRDSR